MNNNRLALITGASRGLGAIVSRALAEKGFTLIMVSRNLDDLESVKNKLKSPEKHRVCAVDLCNLRSIEEKLTSIDLPIGKVEVVIHAAGGGIGLKDSLLSVDDFERLLGLNLSSAIEINRLVIPSMKRAKRGNIIHVGSIASYEAVGSVGYNTVKAGICGYVRSIGREVLKDGIILSGILPGGFISDGNAMDRLRSRNPEAYENFIKERLPRGEMGKAEELIPIISLLCERSAAMFGGCLIPVDAGEGKAYFV